MKNTCKILMKSAVDHFEINGMYTSNCRRLSKLTQIVSFYFVYDLVQTSVTFRKTIL